MYIRKPSQNCISIPIYNIDFVFTNAHPIGLKLLKETTPDQCAQGKDFFLDITVHKGLSVIISLQRQMFL